MNSLISSDYAAQNRKLHEEAGYGIQSANRIDDVLSVINLIGASTVLDYGCGKALLHAGLSARPEGFLKPCTIVNYDPAIPELADAPEPADLVVCTDVLEHVEPELLENVIADLRRLTRKMLYAAVSLRPSSRTLPDGRNAHLIIEPASWWMPKLRKDFTPCRTNWNQWELVSLLQPR